MKHSTSKMQLLQRISIAAVMLIGLWCTTVTADETGTIELVTTFERDFVTIEHAGHAVTGGSLRGTTTVTRSDGGPFVEGETNLVVCIFYGTMTDTGINLEAPCTNTDSSGDTWFWTARRTAGDTHVGGEGRRELLGGTGKYAGVSGACAYSTRYMEDNWIVSQSRCEWHRQ